MTITPERGGIPSAVIQQYVEFLNNAGLSTHSILIARGRDILYEAYYAPFHPDYLHRMYSETKSFTALAVGFAIQDGLVALDDPIGKYFPTECANLKDPKMGEQTVRQMLKMSTPKNEIYWLTERSDDRVWDYFNKFSTAAPLGSAFQYDSSGSFILCAMVERVTGKRFVDYLREKFLDKIGVSEELHCLKVPGGHSWGDSAILAKPRDMMKVIRFILDDGCVDGEQVLNAEYLAEATANLIESDERTGFCSFGYGYQIWRTYADSFFFNGMGSQFALGNRAKDLIFIINSDNQGIEAAGNTIVKAFFEMVYPHIGAPLPEDPAAQAALAEFTAGLKLTAEKGAAHSAAEQAIDGKTFVLEDNPMGIKRLCFRFSENGGVLEYENAQGEKTLPFGLCENCFTLFPEEGYAREVGSVITPGNYYKCAVSGAWHSSDRLSLNVQVIDEYFGRLWMLFDFCDSRVKVTMQKCAEDFFDTYQGQAVGAAQ